MQEHAAVDVVEDLAIRLFSRDHPSRLWRPRLGDRFAPDDPEVASIEERALYRDFAFGQLAGPLDPGPR